MENHLELALAAASEVRMKVRLASYRLLGFVDGFNFENETKEGVKSYIVRSAFYEIEQLVKHRDSFVTLRGWISEINDKHVNSEADIALNKVLKSLDVISRTYSEFDPEQREADYISDSLVPRGDTHYKMRLTFDYAKRIFVCDREEAASGSDDGLWFSYYGPPENELGLIAYLDY